MKLPSDTVIAPEKLTKYLLVQREFDDESQFLQQAGYTLDNWEQFEADLRLHVLPLRRRSSNILTTGTFLKFARHLLVRTGKPYSYERFG